MFIIELDLHFLAPDLVYIFQMICLGELVTEQKPDIGCTYGHTFLYMHMDSLK